MQRLKKMDASLNKDTPIIVMTANAVTGAKRMYLAEGFDDYISKMQECMKTYFPDEVK